tara:strand:- start:5 stop:886 length:882 start_codon:yes stop_codon:yes gene_type:complete
MKTLKKILSLLHQTFMMNILNRSTIDLMAFSLENNLDLKSLIKKKDSSWKSPIFGINRDWMVDALEEGRAYESFLLKSMYVNAFSKTDALVDRIFSQELKFNSNLALQKFLMTDYYDKKRVLETNYETRNERFNESLFKYEYLLTVPESVYKYDGLINRIEIDYSHCKDSYERDDLLKNIIEKTFTEFELPTLAREYYKFELKRQLFTQTHNLPEIFNLTDIVKDFNTTLRKLRNQLVHPKSGFTFVGLELQDIRDIYYYSDLIEYSLIWNLAFHSFPDAVEILDFDWESIQN